MAKRNHASKGAGPSQRQLRAGELVRHALVGILSRDPPQDAVLEGVSITVGEVRASPDLKHMTAFVSPLGRGSAETIAAALNRHAGYLRGRLGREIALRYTPDLRFLADSSYEEAARIEALLAQPEVARDLGEPSVDETED